MPQRSATMESLPMAFALVKEMQADGLEWGEGYRPLGREALAEIIQGQMAEAVDYWLDSLDGLATRDLTRCRHMARLVALIYNWWSLFVRLADPERHREAITGRPLLLHGVARQTHHAGQTRLTVTSHHGRREAVAAALRRMRPTRCLMRVRTSSPDGVLPGRRRTATGLPLSTW